MARKGKIARLPLALREEVNRRLLEGQSAAKILPWLNELPATIAALEEDFEGLRISDQNLSEWRKGGFAEWLARRERLDSTRELAQFAAQMTQAGGSLSDGASAIAAGKLLEVLEGFGDTQPDPDTLAALSLSISRLRAGDQNAEKLRLVTLRLDQTADLLELEKQKFHRQTCESFLKWREDQKANDIAAGPGDYAGKIEALGQHFFGDLWTPTQTQPQPLTPALSPSAGAREKTQTKENA